MRSYRVIIPAASVLLAGCCAAVPGLASEAANILSDRGDLTAEQESELIDAESEPDLDPEPLDLTSAINTKFSSAAAIQIGQQVSDELVNDGSLYAAKYYLFELPESGILNLQVDWKGLQSSYISYSILDENGEMIWSYNSTNIRDDWNYALGYAVSECNASFLAGTYYLTVSCSEIEACGPYTFELNFEPAGESFPEAWGNTNNSFDTAIPIKLGETYTGQVAVNDQYDFYQIELPESGWLTLDITTNWIVNYARFNNDFASNTEITSYVIYDAKGNKVWSYDNGNDWVSILNIASTSQRAAFSAGTYYLCISSAGAFGYEIYDGSYQFTLSFEGAGESFAEEQGGSNNTASKAFSIELGETYTGFLSRDDNIDCYVFDLDEDHELYLNFDFDFNRNSSSMFYLSDETGSKVWSYSTSNNGTTVYDTVDLPAGTYYLIVGDISGLVGSYSFSIKITPDVSAMTGETLNDGIYTGTGTGRGGKFNVDVTITGGIISAVEVGSNNETQGIGSNAIATLPDEMIGLSTADEVDAVANYSGATFTSNAIKTAVKDCLEQASAGEIQETSENNEDLVEALEEKAVEEVLGAEAAEAEAEEPEATEAAAGSLTDGTYTGSGVGIGGRFNVDVTITDGVISAVEVGSNNETQGIGSNAIATLPDEMIGLSTEDEVDAVANYSGASITSRAIKSAVKDALEQSYAADPAEAVFYDVSEGTNEETAEEQPRVIYDMEMYGILSDCYIQLGSFDAEITAAAASFNNYCLSDLTTRRSYYYQAESLQTRIAEQADELNGLELASISRYGDTLQTLKDLNNDLANRIRVIVEAWEASINAGYAATSETYSDILAADTVDGVNIYKTDFDARYGNACPALPTWEDGGQGDSSVLSSSYRDGTYIGSGTGIGGKFNVTVTISNGVIAAVEVGDNNETQGIGSNAIDTLPSQMIGLSSEEEVDAVDNYASASITSRAIKSAVKEALEQAAAG